MIELLAPPRDLQLPLFTGSFETRNHDVDNLIEALKSPDDYWFEARLPEIVGFMPEQEATALSALVSEGKAYTNFAKNRGGFQDELETLIPDTLTAIRADIALVSGGDLQLGDFEVRKQAMEPGQPIFGDGEPHTDGPVRTDEDAATTEYLICDKVPTLYYKGPARFTRWSRMLDLDVNSLEVLSEENTVAAPALAIVRMSLATVHASPIPEAGGDRMFVRAFSHTARAK